MSGRSLHQFSPRSASDWVALLALLRSSPKEGGGGSSEVSGTAACQSWYGAASCGFWEGGGPGGAAYSLCEGGGPDGAS